MIFVAVYHRFQKRLYTFRYNVNTEKTSGVKMVDVKNSSSINFSLRSFYNQEWDETYTFFRQGQVVTANFSKSENLHFEQMTKADLGDMYLAFERALIVRSSNSVLLFKKVEIEVEESDSDSDDSDKGKKTIWRW